jgi:hypothetical protein
MSLESELKDLLNESPPFEVEHESREYWKGRSDQYATALNRYFHLHQNRFYGNGISTQEEQEYNRCNEVLLEISKNDPKTKWQQEQNVKMQEVLGKLETWLNRDTSNEIPF